jgi:hypothetical protein
MIMREWRGRLPHMRHYEVLLTGNRGNLRPS